MRELVTYPSSSELLRGLRSAVHCAGGAESVAGVSVQGKPIVRFDLGRHDGPRVMLTSLMHGVEVIGAWALLDVVRRLTAHPLGQRLLEVAHLTILPIVNPDALEVNLGRIGRGQRAWQRCNANGVDLNRNFPQVTRERLLHPFSGSRFRFSPHYIGPSALSEPESRAVHEVALEKPPQLSLAFHSFGNLLLYPWAHTARPNPRAKQYRALGATLNGALARFPYRVLQARQLYSVLGDMDDWMDSELGTLAFTVEVSRPQFSLQNLGRLLNPFHWMNPERREEVVEDLSPGVLALMSAAV
ncbi:MAG TPA: M14 family metallopeptidase [Polyangiaceae bacterium]|jgi:predicted deacylase|nr:M14 family metallopeptidase [Polyangiaceae bacterium]